MKQEALAMAIGVSQQTISNIEASEKIDENKLREISKEVDVNTEVIKNFSEEAVFNIIGNSYHDHSSSLNYGCTFSPIDKLVEIFDKNKELYKALLQAEKDKVAYL